MFKCSGLAFEQLERNSWWNRNKVQENKENIEDKEDQEDIELVDTLIYKQALELGFQGTIKQFSKEYRSAT